MSMKVILCIMTGWLSGSLQFAAPEAPSPETAPVATQPARSGNGSMTADQQREDLNQLQQWLQQYYARVDQPGYDWAAALQQWQQSITTEQPIDQFIRQAVEFLGGFGDRTLKVGNIRELLPPGYLPANLQKMDGRWVGLKLDFTNLLLNEYPYVTRIDGRPIDEWIVAAQAQGAGSGTAAEAWLADRLRWSAAIRQSLGLEPKNWITLELSNGSDPPQSEGITLTLLNRFASGDQFRPPGLRAKSQRRPDNIGYVRWNDLATASNSKVLDEIMHQMQGTTGLILDLRGSADQQIERVPHLLSYFQPTEEPLRIVAVMNYRLADPAAPHSTEGYLSAWGCYPLTSTRWNSAERAMLEAHARTFKPTWSAAAEQFSAPHYLAVRPGLTTAVYHYPAPVIVLVDERTKGAAELVAMGLQGRPRVMLAGATTAGEICWRRTFQLPHSGLTIQLPAVNTYFPAGRLFDETGITPDLQMMPTLTDLTGKTDSRYDWAVKQLK
ncbi:MAG: hypothetical protein HJJLKODD_01706 [Phycisphaerae bacterium]|nr:hypothetical protein [Phycisphaerae bacterium]